MSTLTTLTRRFLAVGLMLALTGQAVAQDEKTPEPAKAPAFVRYPDKPAVSVHRLQVGDQVVDYMAIADTMVLVGDKDEEKARVFYVAYRKFDPTTPDAAKGRRLLGDEAYDKIVGTYDGPLETAAGLARALIDKGEDPLAIFKAPDAGERPITFSFNGGPGSSSVWLHLGLFGPKRVKYADDVGNPGPPPYELQDNAFSLLDRSDFVFIDPVSTGYSRATEKDDARQYHGVEPDIRSVAEFIRRYVSRTGRWRSPKFIAGESYGTTRAAGLAQELHDTHGMNLNGVILISALLHYSTVEFDTSNDLPYICFLPSYAATAHYHHALGDRYQNMAIGEFVAEVREFARGEYASALMMGDSLEPDRRAQLISRVAAYTGLSPDYVDRANLRPVIYLFTKELLRDRRQTVGRLDSRFTGIDRDAVGAGYEYDPSYAAIQGIYTACLNSYVREELGYQSDLPYEILTNVGPWDYGRGGNNQYLDIAERLRSVMHEQPYMKVFVAAGYYDLATPLFGIEETIQHMGLAADVRGNIQVHEYEAGHMMYIHRPSLEKLRGDLDAFYDAAMAP
ncbi:MAG: hypothetical protein R3B57_12480 [Phycisphaerales bacterium]